MRGARITSVRADDGLAQHAPRRAARDGARGVTPDKRAAHRCDDRAGSAPLGVEISRADASRRSVGVRESPPMRHVGLAVDWVDRNVPSVRWQTREVDEARAILPFGRTLLELLNDAGSLCVSAALEDCRLDDDETLEDALLTWESQRDASPLVRDRVEILPIGRVVYARIFVDDDADDAALEAQLDAFVAWLRSVV